MGLLGAKIGGIAGGGLGQAIGQKYGGGIGGKVGGEIGKIGGEALGALLPFKKGGKVPGPRGKPRAILAHGGEFVLPSHIKPTKAQRDAVKRAGGRM